MSRQLDHPMPRVSVVIPAYNASRWIGKTLKSAQSQTLHDIEIIVVDDGSSDSTAAIVEGAMAIDPRITLHRQANGGVARARNAGIELARAKFIAPLDADDLWHPTRLEKHLAAFSRGPNIGMVYSPCVYIDLEDRVHLRTTFEPIEGEMFFRHLCVNFVGNGSGITVRAAAFQEVGGYWPHLRDQVAQGYEDWHLQLRIAHEYEVACVDEELIGYRGDNPENMGAQSLQMRRSNVLMVRDIRKFASDAPAWCFWFPQANASANLAAQYVRERKWNEALGAVLSEGYTNPLIVPVAAVLLASRLAFTLRRRLSADQSAIGPHFSEFDASMVRRGPLTRNQRIICSVYGRLDRKRAERRAASRQLSPESTPAA